MFTKTKLYELNTRWGGSSSKLDMKAKNINKTKLVDTKVRKNI